MLCSQANILLVYVWLPFGYLVPSCCNYFGCTSFFVDIYHHDFVYLESYTLERSCISRWYPFFHVHLVFLMLFLWWLRESFCLECVSYLVASWCALVWWRLFSSCLPLRGFCHLNWYLLHPSNDISVTSISSCILPCFQPCVGCILAWYSFHVVILGSFLKASQRWSHITSCDVFYGCVVGLSFIYNKTICSQVLCF